LSAGRKEYEDGCQENDKMYKFHIQRDLRQKYGFDLFIKDSFLFLFRFNPFYTFIFVLV